MSGTVKLKGGLSIARPSDNSREPYIQIEVNDELSGSRFLSLRIGLANFAEALTGLGNVECEFDLRPQLVGLKHEHKEEFVPLASDQYFSAGPQQRAEIAALALAPFEIDGWKGRVDDLFNQHRRIRDGARVVFVRHVPVDTPAPDSRESDSK